MFDVGGLELLLIAIVGLLVIGPERLPEMLRTLGLWTGRLRRSFMAVKTEIEKEVGMDEIKRQLHNESVMEQMKKIEQDVQATAQQASIDPGIITGENSIGATSQADTEVAQQQDELVSEDPTQHIAEHIAEPQGETESPVPRTEAEVEAAYARKMGEQE